MCSKPMKSPNRAGNFQVPAVVVGCRGLLALCDVERSTVAGGGWDDPIVIHFKAGVRENDGKEC